MNFNLDVQSEKMELLKKNRGGSNYSKGIFKLKKYFTEKIGFSLTNQS